MKRFMIGQFGKFDTSKHLWNGKVEGNGHYPALKSLRVEDGWGDIELEECYQWIGELVCEVIN